MAKQEQLQGIWTQMSAEREPVIRRAEEYASLTLPKLMPPDGYDKEDTDLAHDYQSMGAQAVNNLTNRMMLAMFAPSRPFFRISPTPKVKALLEAQGIKEADLLPRLGEEERSAMRRLDSLGQRPKLYSTMRHLIAIGNCLLVLDKDSLRVMSLRYYCVKRDITGKLKRLITCEEVCFNELEQGIQDHMRSMYPAYKEKQEHKVKLYKLYDRVDATNYIVRQAVDAVELGGKFNGKYTADTLPVIPLTWDLADEHDYGTGLVEEYVNDFRALSAISEATVDGGVLATEWRWLVNPTGTTSAEDLNNSKNGDALSGTPADIAPTKGGDAQAVRVALEIGERWERRLAQAFLMTTNVIRDAERVTAEEIRRVAQELESSLGGIYSGLSSQIQRPIAMWLLRGIGSDLTGTGMDLSVVTGLDALSRSGDLDSFVLALEYLGKFSTLPEDLQMRFDYNTVVAFVGNGVGIDLSAMMKSKEQYDADLAAAAERRAAEQTATAAGTAAATPGMTPQ
jgi:hypothetical protein